MKSPISITSIASISALGCDAVTIWKNYQNENHFITEKDFSGFTALVSQLSDSDKSKMDEFRLSDNKYKNLDNSVLYGLFVSRRAFENSTWTEKDDFGINIGSSRGATALFEKYHESFLKTGKSETLSSPTTTLGNISSWVAHDLKSKGPEISHSITCSTALHALLNGVAWIQSGMADKFLVGGSEASLTAFTIAQMQALKVYANLVNDNQEYPCKALDLSKDKNTMVIGEGASVACLENGVSENALAVIEGVGYATELLEHNVSISTNAICFQDSMKMAMQNIDKSSVDIIITHTPGTVKGDVAEINAIKQVFGEELPSITTNKWKLGHTFATSGMLSVEMAVLMLQKQEFISVPYIENKDAPRQIKKILVNAVGFGGNAVSVLLRKPE